VYVGDELDDFEGVFLCVVEFVELFDDVVDVLGVIV